MRYLDLLLNSSECPSDLKRCLKSSVPVITDNVTRYFYEGTSQEYWELAKDFPNLAPPFGSFWMESTPPNKINSEGVGIRDSEMSKFISWWGALIQVAETKELSLTASQLKDNVGAFKFEEFFPVVEGIIRAKGWKEGMSQQDMLELYAKLSTEEAEFIRNFSYGLALKEGAKTLTEQDLLNAASCYKEAKWHYNVTLFIYSSGSNNPYNPAMVANLFVNADGSLHLLTPDAAPSTQGLLGKYSRVPFDEQRAFRNFFGTLLNPFWLTISFLHCKNVATCDSAVSDREERRWKNKTGAALIRFKTLVIDHLKSQLSASVAGGDDLKKALHICRGHFSHYSEGRPLFGKYPGTFWIPQHVRGSAEHGIVEKWYDVK